MVKKRKTQNPPRKQETVAEKKFPTTPDRNILVIYIMEQLTFSLKHVAQKWEK